MSIGQLVRRSDRHFYRSAWLAALAGPLAWAGNLDAVFALAPRSCGSGRGLLHLSTCLALVVAAIGALVAWLHRSFFAKAVDAKDRGSPAAQMLFLSTIGLMSNPLFALLIAGQWLAIVLLDPCGPQ